MCYQSCHNEAFKVTLCSTIVIENIHGVFVGVLQLLLTLLPFFISP